MAFTGKSTFSAGNTLPEIAEDVADLVSIVSPYETPLLDALGDSHRVASSTRHEWLEDVLFANADSLVMPGLNDSAMTTTALTVAHGTRFRVGDLVRAGALKEIMMVTAVNTGTNVITVIRGYGASTKGVLTNSVDLQIISNASQEGQDSPDARYTTRSRQNNYTQIFSAGVQVSGSERAVRQLAVANDMDIQKTNRLRELLRDLENTVINGIANDIAPVGSATARRTMRGLLASIQTHALAPGVGGLPDESGLTESMLNTALRLIWETTNSKIDLIVCGGLQKRKINAFIGDSQRFTLGESSYRNAISTYESDFGVCRVLLSRYVPTDAVLLLDSSRISVLPLMGRSFQYKALAPTGDYEAGELLGEYTLEVRNEAAHGTIRGLATE